MKKISLKIKGVVEHPMVKLIVGLILFGSGFAEAYVSFSDDVTNLHFGVHHGVMLLGAVNVLASLPDIIEGLASAINYVEHVDKRRSHNQDKDASS